MFAPCGKEFGGADGYEPDGVARRQQGCGFLGGIEQGERGGANNMPAARRQVGVDHGLQIGNGNRTGGDVSAGCAAPAYGEPGVVHAYVGCAGGEAKHEYVGWILAVQAYDFFFGDLAMAGNVGQVGAVDAAIADGNVDLTSAGGRRAVLEGFAQHLVDFISQAPEACAGAKQARLVMQGDRVEGGNDVADAPYVGSAQGLCCCCALVSDVDVDLVAKNQQHAAVTLRDDFPGVGAV